MLAAQRAASRSRRAARSARGPRSATGRAVGRISCSDAVAGVDLPQPDSPTRPSVSPAAIVELTPSTASTSSPSAEDSAARATGNRLTRSRTVQQRALMRSRAFTGRARSARRVRRAHADAPGRSSRELAAARSAQRSLAGVRAAGGEAAPRRRVDQAGGRPGIAVEPARARGRSSSCGTAREERRGVGVLAARRTAPRGRACSTIWPAYITARRRRSLGDDAEVVGDQDHRHPALAAQVVEQLQDLRLDRHVERGRRLVGDQQLGLAGERDRDHHALAHAAGELVRVVARARSAASRDPDLAPAARRRVAAPRAGATPWCAASSRRSGVPIVQRRVERRSSGPGRSSLSARRARPRAGARRAWSGRVRRRAPRR